MKKMNKKGFTLIELLAVIVILAVLLAIAIPAVAKYINSSKKNTFIENAQSYAKAARSEILDSDGLDFPINQYSAVAVSFKQLESSLENGGITSSYGGTFLEENSYVLIVNIGTPEVPRNVYYVAACDSKGYGIGVTNDDGSLSAAALAYDALKKENVLQLGTGRCSTRPAENSTISGLSGIPAGQNVTVTKTVY